LKSLARPLMAAWANSSDPRRILTIKQSLAEEPVGIGLERAAALQPGVQQSKFIVSP